MLRKYISNKPEDVQRTWDEQIPCTCSQPAHCDRYHGLALYPQQTLMTAVEFVAVFQSIWQKIYPVTYERHVHDPIMRNGKNINVA